MGGPLAARSSSGYQNDLMGGPKVESANLHHRGPFSHDSRKCSGPRAVAVAGFVENALHRVARRSVSSSTSGPVVCRRANSQSRLTRLHKSGPSNPHICLQVGQDAAMPLAPFPPQDPRCNAAPCLGQTANSRCLISASRPERSTPGTTRARLMVRRQDGRFVFEWVPDTAPPADGGADS
jgi:hypothetical protein